MEALKEHLPENESVPTLLISEFNARFSKHEYAELETMPDAEYAPPRTFQWDAPASSRFLTEAAQPSERVELIQEDEAKPEAERPPPQTGDPSPRAKPSQIATAPGQAIVDRKINTSEVIQIFK